MFFLGLPPEKFKTPENFLFSPVLEIDSDGHAIFEYLYRIFKFAIFSGFSEEEIKRLLTKILDRKDISKEEIEHIQKLQNSLRAAGLGDAR